MCSLQPRTCGAARAQELIEFDAQGRPITRGEHDDEDGDDDGWGVDADGDDGFGASGWDQFGAAAAEGVGADSDAADDGGPSQVWLT